VHCSLEPLRPGETGTHHHISVLPVGDAVGFAESLEVGDLQLEPGVGDEPADLFPVGGKVPFNESHGHFGEGLAVGLADVEDVDDSVPHNSPFLLFSILGRDLADDGGEDLQSPFTASHLPVEFLPGPVAGHPARGEAAG